MSNYVFSLPEQARVLDEKRDQILAAAKKHGKTCAMLCSSQEQARHWKEAGALLLAYSSDSGICSTRLNDRFPLQDSANRLIRIEPATCCGANDGSNGSEKIGTPV